jgi:hypothetical protein
MTTLSTLPQWFKGLYRPRGRAGEYAKFAVEPYGRSCQHKCAYCYAPAIAKKTRDKFAEPKPDMKILDKLRIDLDEYADIIRPEHIQLGFFCDPYQPCEEEFRITRQIIELLHDYDMKVQILTKSKLVLRDFDILRKDDKVGCTLTFDNQLDSAKWEPNASTPHERIAVLTAAHEKGFSTWASLEPVIYPTQTIRMVLLTSGVVDLYKVGHTNHVEDFPPELQEIVNRIDWLKDGPEIIKKAQETGAEVYVKKDLREALGVNILNQLGV